MARARYDGHADWYEDSIAAYSATATPLLLRLVGAGSGRCLDVGCRTGAHLAALAGAGWSVMGVDASADQLRVARRRPGPLGTALVQADAARLPFADGGLDLVVSGFTHTDVDDFAALPGYRKPGWRSGGPGTMAGGLTSRVGFHHLPLADLMMSILDAGLVLVQVEEGGNSDPPDWLALVARR